MPLDQLDIKAPAQDWGGDLVGNPIPQEILDRPDWQQHLAKIFLAGVPWYEWNVFAEEASVIIYLYIRYLAQLPEYQLM